MGRSWQHAFMSMGLMSSAAFAAIDPGMIAGVNGASASVISKVKMLGAAAQGNGIDLGVAADGSTIAGAAVLMTDPQFGVNADGRGGAGWNSDDGTLDGVSVEGYVAFKSDWIAGLDPSEVADVLEFITLTIHEFQHSQSWTWQYEKCKADAAAAAGGGLQEFMACAACFEALDKCMNESSGSGNNPFEESRAAYVAFLCLCQIACDPANAANADELKMKADEELQKAQVAWSAGNAAFDACAEEGPPGCSYSSYPMPPINIDGDAGDPSNAYAGPPSGLTTCDCESPPPIPEDFDPCESEG